MTSRPRVLLLKHFDYDYSEWERHWVEGTRAGRLGPYGAECLERLGFELLWTQSVHRKVLASKVPTKLRGRLERDVSRRGLVNAVLSLPLARKADCTIAIFEDQATFAALLKRRGVSAYKHLPMVVLVCWLAERVQTMTPAEVRRLANALSRVDVFLTFSDQQEVLLRYFPFMQGRLHRIDFGVDTTFFQTHTPASARSISFLAVGRDYSRDYDTLVRAVHGTEYRLTIVCGRRNLPENVPSNVEVLEEIDPSRYRQLLREAQVVVTPTTAPAYPSGQTVVLEAMASGCATISTDSPAMREYVNDQKNGLLVARGDVVALREAMGRLAANPDSVDQLGRDGQVQARRRFTQEQMWAQIAGHLTEALGRTGA